MSESLVLIFSNLISKFSNEEELKFDYWKEIKKNYSQKKRKYHNLLHLENMILELENVKDKRLRNELLYYIFNGHTSPQQHLK